MKKVIVDGIPNLPVIDVSAHQLIWLNEAWNQLKSTGNNPAYTTIKKNTLNEVGTEFTADKIDDRLIKNKAVEITLLGILFCDPKSNILDDADKILFEIKRIIRDDMETSEFDIGLISEKIGFDKKYAQIVFTLASIYGNFFNGSSSTQATNGPFGYEHFRIQEPRTIDYYLDFSGIRKAIDNFYIERARYDKKIAQYKPSRHSVGLSVPSDFTYEVREYFVDETRLEELKTIERRDFDLTRLIQQCNELNICYNGQCYLAVAMLTRSLIDHIPPIFGKVNFSEVVGSYGNRSFRESMTHLDKSSRKIADAYLHSQIRNKEALPNRTQVNFSRDVDVLLSEVVRILSTPKYGANIST